jgi:DNA repair protein RecO (recombination protein O)
VGQYHDTGVVLRTYKLGEGDRIVVMLTLGHGKVRAVAKGVRKTKSRLGVRLEPFTHVRVLMHEGRELDVVSQAEAIDHFKALRENLEGLARGAAVVEVVDQIAQERQPDPRLYQMLLGALRTLAARPSPLVVPAFYWKVLANEGVRPQLDACVGCGAGEPFVSFDVAEGGVLCRACRRGPAVTPAALALMRRILGGDLVAVLAEPPSPAGHDVEVLATRAMEHHLERRLRTAGVLDHH